DDPRTAELRPLYSLGQPPEILDERLHLDLAALVIRRPQDRGWMDRRHHQGEAGALDKLAPLEAHAEITPEQRLGGGGTQQDEDRRLDQGDLGIQPGTAGADLGGIRLLM